MVKIAYLILAHKHPEQLARLVRGLSTGKTSFFVHVDGKTGDETYGQMVRRLGDLPNVQFLERQKVYWGQFSLVDATIKGIKEIVDGDVPFDYIVFLSGQDYPIKSNLHIEKTLRENEPYSFMEYFSLPDARWHDGDIENGGLERVEYWHFHLFGRVLRFPAKRRFRYRIFSLLWSILIFFFPIKRKFPTGFKPFGGSAFWCLSRDGADYLVRFVEQNRAYVNFFRRVLIPDEIFFQTILLNTPLKNRVINDNLRYIRWVGSSSHPEILRTDDFEEIARSPELFARKFDATVDACVLDMIDRKLLSED